MKAVYINEQGGIDKLIYGERPEPSITPGEVLVRVRATALNHLDIYARSGGNNVLVECPRILGTDVAGEVAQVGEEVTAVRPGARVLLNHLVSCGHCDLCVTARDNLCPRRRSLGTSLDGGYAEYVKVPEENVHLIPEWMSFEEAAAIPMVFMTAWHMLVQRARIRPGEDVLVMAAGSGTGSAAIQVAKFFGARVIAAASTDEKLQRAKELGAEEGINYTQTPQFSSRVKEITAGQGVDLIFDPIGASVWEENFASLKLGGRLVICGVLGGHRAQIHLGRLFVRQLAVIGSGYTGTKEDLRQVMRLVHRKLLRGVVGKTFPLQDAAEAHRTMEERDFFGKLVLQVP